MHRSFAYAMLLAAGLAAAGHAQAMDLPPAVYAPETSIHGVGQGWYIRGDLGYNGWMGSQTPSYNVLTNSGALSSVETFDSARFDKNVSYGAGAGYQLNDIFRADATVDFFSSTIDGSSNIGTPCTGQAAGTSCGYTHGGGFKAIGIMGNVYADLGTVAGFTPYVGAGAGMTEVQWGTVTGTPYCVDGAANCNGTTYASKSYEGFDSWRFSYALMAGVSYDITQSLKLDLGYRYSKVNGGDMFGYSAAETALGASGAKGTDDGFSRHEFRAGFRLNTW